MEARTTVICAVWHKQKDKENFLRGHMENLQKQSVPYEVVYVFDGGDIYPDWLEGTKISVSAPLTIYQAWNVALSHVMTPYVMNLNLDDRLARNAIALMEEALDDEPDAILAGGDWLVCFSSSEADNVELAYPIEDEPFHPEWPPVPGRRTRLGSGDGTREIYGPACMWRLKAHLVLPRYPYRFLDGTMIRTIADAAWWTLLQGRLGKQLMRLPVIIGHYLSAPDTQAEFRFPAEQEQEKIQNGIGVSLL